MWAVVLPHGVHLELSSPLSLPFPPAVLLHFLMALQPVLHVRKETDSYMMIAAVGKWGKSLDANVGWEADSPLPV